MLVLMQFGLSTVNGKGGRIGIGLILTPWDWSLFRQVEDRGSHEVIIGPLWLQREGE